MSLLTYENSAVPRQNIRLDMFEKTWLRDEIEMRSLKLLDIGYIAVLYFVAAAVMTVLFDKIFGEWSEVVENDKSSVRIGLELIGMVWLFGVSTYLVRHLVEKIPSPISYIPLSNPGLKFDHRQVKELSNASVFTLILLGTSYHFRKKLEYFYRRITNRF
jgi:hypothetical protein